MSIVTIYRSTAFRQTDNLEGTILMACVDLEDATKAAQKYLYDDPEYTDYRLEKIDELFHISKKAMRCINNWVKRNGSRSTPSEEVEIEEELGEG